MRFGTMGLLGLLGLITAALSSGAAWAADAAPAASPLADGSALAGLGFRDKPFVIAGDAFAETMNRLAAERQKKCGALESFGWELQDDVQNHVDKLISSLMGSLRQAKFVVTEIRSKMFPNSELVVPYSADRADRRLLLLLSLSPPTARDQKAQFVLLICGVAH